MPQQFTPDQIEKLKSLGIKVDENNISPLHQGEMSEGQRGLEPKPDVPQTARINNKNSKLEIRNSKKQNLVFPLLSISGLTLLSFSGIVLLKNKSSTIATTNIKQPIPNADVTPTQVPKSIQHYLLTSQQLFSQALQLQQQNSPTPASGQSTIDLLNQSILAATEAIKEFPQDYRGYQQRGKIYQSLIDSNPKLIDQSISDVSTAQKLNPTSSDITHTLASLYAKKGDAQNTILYLNQTVSLDPTQAQNFYDLAKIQQQAGFIADALNTYNRLVTLITDPTQKSQIETEKSALEKIIAQNPNLKNNSASPSTPTLPQNSDLKDSLDSPTIQAMGNGGLIVAAPEEINKIEVKNQTDSNSLSGNAILSSGQKEISISNSNISSASQVYVTATKGGKNQNLQVISKSDKSFTVGLDTAISEDVEFKWWIIN
jgi:tetratricopeptide (TPR) repeat protein